MCSCAEFSALFQKVGAFIIRGRRPLPAPRETSSFPGLRGGHIPTLPRGAGAQGAGLGQKRADKRQEDRARGPPPPPRVTAPGSMEKVSRVQHQPLAPEDIRVVRRKTVCQDTGCPCTHLDMEPSPSPDQSPSCVCCGGPQLPSTLTEEPESQSPPGPYGPSKQQKRRRM